MTSDAIRVAFCQLVVVLFLVQNTEALVNPSISHSSSSRGYSAAATRRICALPFGVDATTDARHATLTSALSKLQQVQPLSAPFFQKLNKSILVKPSSIPGAGQALFAKSNIKAGSIISFYPIHGMGVEFSESSVCVALGEEDQKHFAQEEKDANYLQFIIGSRSLQGQNVAELFDGDSLFIDVNPDREDEVGWLGHYVNDGATVTSIGEEGVLDYYKRSAQAKNCVHVPFGPCPVLATVATRKIKKGEELFTTYGAAYWLQALAPESELDLTEAIQEKAMETARDIFTSMRSTQVTYQNEAAKLESIFSS